MGDAISLGATEEACIDSCTAVLKATENCVNACSARKRKASVSRTCRDAVTLASTLASLLSPGSPHAATVAEACSDACEAAAGECREHEDDTHCWACVEPLEECADACRDLAS